MAIVGIDLGTTNSLVTAWKDGQVVPVPNALGDHLTPSVVSIEHNGTVLVGKPARERLVTHPTRTASLFKRSMGTAQEFKFGQTSLRAEDLSALVLRSLREDAEAFLGEQVTEAVVSVPAYFNDLQRKATQAAAKIAGLQVDRLINEPTAAAVAYGIGRIEQEGTFLVFDLGGGTFDVSILELYDRTLQVHASAGDIRLGGEDFRWRLAEMLLRDQGLLWETLGLEERASLMGAVELAKNQMSTQETVLVEGRYGGKDVAWPCTRELFQSQCRDLRDRMRAPVERALRDARLDPQRIDQVLMVGGATRMPMVRDLAAELLGKTPRTDLDPDRVVALGAGIQAMLKSSESAFEDVVLTDVCPWSLGVSVQDGRTSQNVFSPIIERNRAIPTSRSRIYGPVQDFQPAVSLRVYQGESLRLEGNVFLGELEVKLPRGRKEENGFEVRFTYDINGILEVLVTHLASGKVDRLVLEQNPGSLSPEQIEERLRSLAHLKLHPRERLEIRSLVERAERLYEESLGQRREAIKEGLTNFQVQVEDADQDSWKSLAEEFADFLERQERSWD